MCPFCKTGSLDTLGDHAVACHDREYMLSRHDHLGDNVFFPLAMLPTCHRAEKPDTRNKFSTWRCVFTLLVFWATGSSGCNHYHPTATHYYFKCGEEIWFCPESCGSQEVGAILPTMCNRDVQFIPMVDSLNWSERH